MSSKTNELIVWVIMVFSIMAFIGLQVLLNQLSPKVSSLAAKSYACVEGVLYGRLQDTGQLLPIYEPDRLHVKSCEILPSK